MAEFIKALYELPSYIQSVLTGPNLPYAIVAGVVFLLVLFINNRITNLIRQLFVLAAVLIAVFAFKTGRYSLMLLCFFVLILLEVFRFFRYTLTSIRQNHINRRIEERALAKAASRRGAFVNKQAYSGEMRPIVDPDADKPMNAEEIREVVDAKEEHSPEGKPAQEPELKETKAKKPKPKKEKTMPDEVRAEKPPLEKAPVKEASAEEASGNEPVLKKTPVKEPSADEVRKKTASKEAPAEEPAPEEGKAAGDSILTNRDQILSAIDKLKELKNAGILTEAEFKSQTAALYEKLG